MDRMKTVRLIVLAVLCLFLLRVHATADLKIHQKTQSSGFAGIGATEGEETLLVKALMQKQVSSMKFTQGVVKFFAGSGPKVSTKITRLDKELVWNIDDEKKTYTETTFAKLREQMKEAEEKAAKEEKKDEDTDVKRTVNLDLKNTGEKKTINGFPCEHFIVELTVVAEKVKTKEKSDELYITTDMWVAPSLQTVQDEITAFSAAEAAKLGFGGGGMNEAVTKQYGSHLKELSGKMKGIKGYPVVNELTMETPAGSGGGEKKEAVEEEKKPEAKEEEETPSLGGIFGKIAKSASKEKDKEKENAEKKDEPKPTKPGRNVIFSTRIEVTEAAVSPVLEAEFTVPAGYELKD